MIKLMLLSVVVVGCVVSVAKAQAPAIAIMAIFSFVACCVFMWWWVGGFKRTREKHTNSLIRAGLNVLWVVFAIIVVRFSLGLTREFWLQSQDVRLEEINR